jgi:hypothetical protein
MEESSKRLPEASPREDATGARALRTETGGPPKSGKRKWRRWGGGLFVALLLCACLYGFRAPILRGVATYLVLDEQSTTTDYILILPGVDKRYERAAVMYHGGSANGILLVETRPMRLERMGFAPSFGALSQRELVAYGVPANSIMVIPGQGRTDWDRARSLRDWLEQRPDARVLVFCDRFGGRKFRYIFDQVLGAEHAHQVRVTCIPERSFDENNWWQHREAVVAVFDAYVHVAYARFCGEDSEEWREWDPEEFKKTLH